MWGTAGNRQGITRERGPLCISKTYWQQDQWLSFGYAIIAVEGDKRGAASREATQCTPDAILLYQYVDGRACRRR
jgi:hypothetical protein